MIDFISVGNFPVFNVADSSISLGVAVLILGVWLQERKQKKIEAAAVEAPCWTRRERRIQQARKMKLNRSLTKQKMFPKSRPFLPPVRKILINHE